MKRSLVLALLMISTWSLMASISRAQAGGKVQIGNRVLCINSAGDAKAWYLAKVTGVGDAGQIDLQYLDYPKKERVSADRIRVVRSDHPPLPKKGDQVFCRDSNHVTQWYPAQIVAVQLPGNRLGVRFSFPYESTADVNADQILYIQPAEVAPAREVGDWPLKLNVGDWPLKVKVQKLEWNPATICTMMGSCLGLVCVVFGFRALRPATRYDAETESGGPLLLIYKFWHFPAFCVANSINPPFLLLVGCFLVSLVVVVVLTGAGYVIAGTLLGVNEAIIAGILCLALAVFFICPALNNAMVDLSFRERLTNDMLSSRPTLQTVGKGWLLWWCFVQSVVLLGIAGSLAGSFLHEGRVSVVPLAVISAFFAILLGQMIAYARKSTAGTTLSYSLAAVQLVVGAVLFYPLKAVVADKEIAVGLVDALQNLTGSEWGMDMVFMGIGGVVVALFNNFALARTSDAAR